MARARGLWRGVGSGSSSLVSLGVKVTSMAEDTLGWDDEYNLERAEKWMLLMEYAPGSQS